MASYFVQGIRIRLELLHAKISSGHSSLPAAEKLRRPPASKQWHPVHELFSRLATVVISTEMNL